MANEIEPRKAKQVATGGIRKKKSPSEAVLEDFLGRDIHTLKSEIINEWIVPKVKEIILGAVQTALFGGGISSAIGTSRNYNKVGYGRNTTSTIRQEPNVERIDQRVLLTTRGEAEAVLREMQDLVEEYGNVSIAQMCQAAACNDYKWSDNKYGWTNLTDARVMPDSGMWTIHIPARAKPL